MVELLMCSLAKRPGNMHQPRFKPCLSTCRRSWPRWRRCRSRGGSTSWAQPTWR